jgi:hypothetical protein
MTVVVNKDTGLYENLPDDQASSGLSGGTHEVALIAPDGTEGSAPPDAASDLLSKGYKQPSPSQLQSGLDYAKNQEPSEQVKAFLEGAGEAGTFGLSTGLETAAGVNPEDINRRRESGYHAAGQLGGLGASALTGVGEAEGLSALGEAGQAITGLGGEGAGVLSNIGATAARMGAENIGMAAGDEMSRFLSNDPNQSAETAIQDIGLSGLIGAGAGAAFGSVSPIWKLANGTKAAQFLEDFSDRMKARVNNLNPVESLTKELGDYHTSTSAVADDVYGAKGLKARAVQSLVPESMTPEISAQSQKLFDQVDQVRNEIAANPDEYPGHLARQFDRQAQGLQDAITNPESTPGDIFQAADLMKRFTQDMGGGYVKQIDPAYKFVQAMRDLSPALRTGLEDSSVWGKAADIQTDINKAFRQYKPALDDFEKRFTTKLSDNTRQVDPGKIQTYLNHLGKPSAELKQEMLGDYIKASENYRQTIDQVHQKMGLESPVESAPINRAQETLETITPGQRAADYIMNKGIANLAGEGLGAAVGGGVGHLVGHGGIGALIGEHALGPFFKTILPIISKPIIEKGASSEGLKAAVEYGKSVLRGETAINSAVKAVFKSGTDVIPSQLAPSFANREKIKDKIDDFQTDTAGLMNVGGSIGHYLPDHASGLSAAAARATQYLGSIKPAEKKLGPLDPPIKPSKEASLQYDRAIDLAEQPLLALKSVKNGDLTMQDVQTVKTLYPSWYQSVSQKLMNQVINQDQKGEIPYQTKLGLSLFLGQPLDSSLMPASILSDQTNLNAPTLSQQSLPKQGRKTGEGALKNIKLASRTATRTNQEEESGE